MTGLVRSQLDEAVGQLFTLHLPQQRQSDVVRGETARQAAARRQLYENLLKPVARIARFALKETVEYPSRRFVSRQVDRRDFVTRVSTLTDSAAKYESVFISARPRGRFHQSAASRNQ